MPNRYQPPGAIRSFGDQLEELCSETGLLKQVVAAKAKISPAQLSNYLKFGCSIRMIERIAKAVGKPPSYFDVYVVENSAGLIAENPDVLELMRQLHTASDAKRKAILRQLQ